MCVYCSVLRYGHILSDRFRSLGISISGLGGGEVGAYSTKYLLREHVFVVDILLLIPLYLRLLASRAS